MNFALSGGGLSGCRAGYYMKAAIAAAQIETAVGGMKLERKQDGGRQRNGTAPNSQHMTVRSR
jgi:hypothetical protein